VPITLHLPNVLAKLADDQRTIEVTGPTLGDAVAQVTQRFPGLRARLADDRGAAYPFVGYYVNDEDARYVGGFGAAVRDGDQLTIVPALAGG
jgi:molybdopterin converting factor small subunit